MCINDSANRQLCRNFSLEERIIICGFAHKNWTMEQNDNLYKQYPKQ